MSRKKRVPDPGLFPDPGDEKPVEWLPREIKMGLPAQLHRGYLMSGWDTNTDTYQLWRVIDVAPPRAEFVGYIVGAPPGGVRKEK